MSKEKVEGLAGGSDWLSGVTAEGFPHISKLLSGKHAEAVREELGRLVPRAWRMRAPRHSMRVLGRLVTGNNALTVMVHDVSRTGVRVAEPRRHTLHVMARDLRFDIEIATKDGCETLHLPVVFVRVAATEDDVAYLAFQFTEITEYEATRLEHLANLVFA